MEKIKIVHIYSDAKFVSEVNKYKSEQIVNRVIFIGEKYNVLPTDFNEDAIFFPPRMQQLPDIVQACSGADLVVINELDSFKAFIALQIPQNTKIAWRFYGYELYSKVRNRVISNETYKILKKDEPPPSIIGSIKTKLFKGLLPLSPFYRAIIRCNYFLGVFEEEYKLLKSWGFSLPKFVRIPLRHQPDLVQFNAIEKQPTVIVGNSRSYYNNHIDILRMFQNTVNTENITLKLFFNYGPDLGYADFIRTEARKMQDIHIVENFLPRQVFETIYNEAAALVINSYRQMALGNIFTAVRSGTKIYLSTKNITRSWLTDNNITTYSVEQDLLNDYKTGNVFLKEEDAVKNINSLNNMTAQYTFTDFQDTLTASLKP